jgi:hypothetical protein
VLADAVLDDVRRVVARGPREGEDEQVLRLLAAVALAVGEAERARLALDGAERFAAVAREERDRRAGHLDDGAVATKDLSHCNIWNCVSA